jgi:type I restriction enzyme R subunit
METFVRVYTFLSQIFDYANTDVEKRSIFYKLLLPRLKFGRERTDIDLFRGGHDAPRPESEGERDDPAYRGGQAEAGSDDRGRLGTVAAEAKGTVPGDH